MRFSSILTVVTKAATYDLTTLEAVKEELGIEGNARDTRLARWIRDASGYAADYCSRVFATEQVSETWRASDRWGIHDHSLMPAPLKLNRYPVVSIDSIIEADTVVLQPTDYEVDAETGLLWRLRGGLRSHWHEQKMVVLYSGGFDVPRDEPPQLEQACLMLIKVRNDGITRDRLQRSQVIPGVLQEEWWNPATSGSQVGMPPEIDDILSGFRDYRP